MPTQRKPRYRMKRASITHVSLCPRGKTGLRTVFKADGGDSRFDALVKADMESGELLAVVYAPELPDRDGDVADAEVIKAFAHSFMRDHRNVDVLHDERALPKDKAYVAESFMIGKGDLRFADFKDYSGQVVDVTGGWAVVIKIEDEALRAAYRSGAWDGVSMFGQAIFEPVAKADGDLEEVVQRIFDRLTKATKQDTDMTKEEFAALLAEHTKALVAEVKKALQPEQKPAPEQKPEGKPEQKPDADPMPVFKGDLKDRDAVEKYQAELETWQFRTDLAKAQASGDAAKVAEVMQRVAKSAPEVTDEQAEIEEADTAEVKKLKRQLYKARQSSRQPDEDEGDEQNLSKADREARDRVQAGERIADIANQRRGYAAKK